MFTLGLQKKKKKNIPLPSLKPSDALTQQANVLVAQHIGSIYQGYDRCRFPFYIKYEADTWGIYCVKNRENRRSLDQFLLFC